MIGEEIVRKTYESVVARLGFPFSVDGVFWNELTIAIDAAVEAQLAEVQADGITLATQNRIRYHVVKLVGCDENQVDGSGCDSGDPVDLTLTEIGQGINILQEQLAWMREALVEAKQAIRDAIVLEDGLDGAEGERVIALIGDALAALEGKA